MQVDEYQLNITLYKMIKRTQLKCPIIVLVVNTALVLVLQITLLILQPISGYLGYNSNQTITETCNLDSYLTLKLGSSKYIFASSYTALAVAFIFTLLGFSIALHSLIIHFKDQPNKQSDKDSRKYKDKGKQQIPILSPEYDSAFTYWKLIICCICYLVSICGMILEFGDTLWMNICYIICRQLYSKDLISISALSLAILILLFVCLIVIMVLRQKIHNFLNHQKETNKVINYQENATLMNLNEISQNINKYRPEQYKQYINKDQYNHKYARKQQPIRKKQPSDIRDRSDPSYDINDGNSNDHLNRYQNQYYNHTENKQTQQSKQKIKADIQLSKLNQHKNIQKQFRNPTSYQQHQNMSYQIKKKSKIEERDYESINRNREAPHNHYETNRHPDQDIIKQIPKFDQRLLINQQEHLVHQRNDVHNDQNFISKTPEKTNKHFKSSRRSINYFQSEQEAKNPFEQFQKPDMQKNKLNMEPIEKFYKRSNQSRTNLTPQKINKDIEVNQAKLQSKKKTAQSYHDYIRGKYDY